MPDYSEFPTTPTAWQENVWGEVTPLETEDAPRRPTRRVDYVALIPGVVFTLLALTLMSGLSFPFAWFHGGGVLWVLLIVAGIALLSRELRKPRRPR